MSRATLSRYRGCNQRGPVAPKDHTPQDGSAEMSDFRTLDGLDVTGRKVIVRLDLNVPMKNGKVTDSTRIDRSAATVTELAGKGARVIVMALFARPQANPAPEFSLKPLVEPLSKALGRPVVFAADCVGAPAKDTA